MVPTLFQSATASLLLLASVSGPLHASNILAELLQQFTLSNTAATHRAHANAHLLRRDLVIATDLPPGWTSQGCFTDSVSSRALYGTLHYNNASMTEESCISFCSNAGYAYAGVEYSQECYCGNAIGSSGTAADANDCNMACGGDPATQCGGPNRLNLFHNDNITKPTSGPAINAGPPGWGFLGCYTDSVAARTLTAPGNSEGGGSVLTVALCTEACETEGYVLAGVEYSGECYCGNSTSNGGGPAPDGFTGCDMVCNGNATEYCGGPNRLNVYGFGQESIIAPQWTTLGCYTDSVQQRTLRNSMGVLGGPGNMTIENCQKACYAANYPLSGVEYSQECYCGSSFSSPGGPAPDGDTQCDMTCSGDTTETCGGPNRLNVFSYIGAPTSTSTPTSATSTTPTTSTGTGSVASLPSSWTYKGCYVDNANGRILLPQQPDSSSLTVESCVQTCIGLGYPIAGLEYSTQCFCGNAVIDGGVIASDDSQCAMTCSGNSSQICGGPDRVSLYSNSTVKSYAPATVQKTNLTGSWQYQGCLTDIPQPRVLPYQIDMTSNLTVNDCLSLCSEYGYSAGSMEYGQQCFCGDDTDRINAGVAFLDETDCNVPCSGDPTSFCGGANAMNYYTWTGLNTWNQAIGNAAGEYQFLIGGVVIPLITAVGTNGKVTFVEKHGTGPPNSTGAYELDLSQTNNFTAAWRTMNGLKTDVFCSAGLTLPDKVGRQLNIGGWSTESTYGVRLYWPDGSPGVPGVNDWQENFDEVSLQIGRWYPSAMIMANGSILVVGGEDGSNGPPVPNLEIVPKPSGGSLVYCDWLNRTDPNNLYPFLAVLPSGGVFVAYYNEARILDENTFETTTSLPNIPGAVNNFLAGRTYPLEGTAVIMPQHAPYTDPLTILICGGSTPAPFLGIALDNCVSIQPEVAGQNWTIERMPSKRVISCMTALPDGTYLILNGAMQGVAGFGLAALPNHNAVLYDPTQPLNSRFTILANTTIDRLYHSEAILLPDGRVLVSGSDPEGAPYEQEYRVEVFIPPYLMGNTSQPTYTIDSNNTDWAYGESISITITSGTAAKVSLMGAVSSTHGNSMGQRTFFPEFSCSGQSCTITAPPNSHVCPPGWFMVFVLDESGVPSASQWVRIGGDPAGLGKWPNFPDFDLPGV